MNRLVLVMLASLGTSLTGCKLVSTPAADAAARVQVNAADSELPAIAAPGAFHMSVDQDAPTDHTIEVHWSKAENAARYRLTVALGDDCLGNDVDSPEEYEVTSTGVELPPLAPGLYSLCATAIGARNSTTEAENSGLNVVVRGAE